MVRIEGNEIIFPYGAFRLGFVTKRLAVVLMSEPGMVVPFERLAQEVWQRVPYDKRLRSCISSTVSTLNIAARDLGMLNLITVSKCVGYCWAPTELRQH